MGSYIKSECSSKYFGVRYIKARKKYGARVIMNGVLYEVGAFVDEIDAAMAYDQFVNQNGLDKRLNFPEPEPENLIPNTRLIRLTRGRFAIVDEDDYERVNQYKWCCLETKYTCYAYRGIYIDGKSTTIRMHQFIMGNYDSDTDHRNRNGIDNRKSNLRSCTHSENMMNKSAHQGCSSKYKGVIFHNNKFQTKITINKNTINLGMFSNEIEAARAYDSKAIELFGEFARLNFAV